MKPVIFKTRTTLINGKFACKKNIENIYAYSSRICTNVIHRGIDNKTYYERWKLVKEKEGYIFREITHGGGISGHHRTVKRAVIASCGLSHIHIAFEG